MSDHVPPPHDADTVRDMAVERHIESANWTTQANQNLHDNVLVPLWALRPEVDCLALQLKQANDRLAAHEQSTSWRLTAPLRWIVHRITASRRAPGRPAEATDSAEPQPNHDPDRAQDYASWIMADEAACQQAGRPKVFGKAGVARPSLAVILTAMHPAPVALAANLDALRGRLSPSCQLIATCGRSSEAHIVLEQFARNDPNATLVALPDETSAAASKLAALNLVTAEFTCFIDLPDRLSINALTLIGEALALNRDVEILFADEDWIDSEQCRSDPFFKPGWDPELQQAGDLLGRLVVLRTDAVRRITPVAEAADQDWSLHLGRQLAVTCRPDRIRHIPAVLCHRSAETIEMRSPPPVRNDPGPSVVRQPVQRRWARISYMPPHPAPLVTIIVPTRDRADLLRACAAGILGGTHYPSIELLILDNNTTEPDATELLRQLAMDCRVRVLSLPSPFNWSCLNNAGARAARGDVLVLLNNDVVVLEGDWLSEMVSHAVRPEIGAVGAKLLYKNGTLQHAGIVIDSGGVPKHVLRGAPATTSIMNNMLSVVRSVSAVTGACLAVRRSAFFEVGGLDENLAVACNDVDLCLRLRAHGYRNIWTPFAVLEHPELATRGPDRTPAMQERAWAELDRLSRKWGGAILTDPYFNANLVLIDERPRLRPGAWSQMSHSEWLEPWREGGEPRP